MMSELPCDILCNILSLLPAKFLLRLRAVCRYWKRTIDNPLFVKLHTKIQQSCGAGSILIREGVPGGKLFSLTLDRLNDGAQNIDLSLTPLKPLIHPGIPRLGKLRAPACNGLILIPQEYIYGCWVIWNPLTRDFHQVKRSPNIHPPFKGAYTVRKGFGYDEASNDYKVVRVDRMQHGEIREKDGYRTVVYSLKSRCWRVIEGFPGGGCSGGDGAFVEGALHWRLGDGIIALHLGREDHQVMAAPPVTEGRYWNGNLYALDGCLMLNHGHRGCNGMDVWVMRDYGTDKQAWTKLFSVVVKYERRTNMTVVAYLKSKGQVLLQGGNFLKWLDIEDKSSKEVTISVSGSSWSPGLSFCQFVPGSLVRLGSTKSGVKRKRKTKKDGNEGAAYARLGEKVSMPCVSSNFIILPPFTDSFLYAYYL